MTCFKDKPGRLSNRQVLHGAQDCNPLLALRVRAIDEHAKLIGSERTIAIALQRGPDTGFDPSRSPAHGRARIGTTLSSGLPSAVLITSDAQRSSADRFSGS